ncbi:hypothetical protein EDB85DRAFT_2160163 [Lactarius pseudohatsudake]|nr:hypothetical protein EDB85DRAFT_2160163 [Lactarius pseudohatsudake]
MSGRYYIPVNLDKWKWPRRINPHYAEVKAASSAWVRSFGVFSPKAQEAYDRCDFGMSSNYVYACQVMLTYRQTASQLLGTHCRTRPVNVHFVFDEYTDVAREEEV